MFSLCWECIRNITDLQFRLLTGCCYRNQLWNFFIFILCLLFLLYICRFLLYVLCSLSCLKTQLLSDILSYSMMETSTCGEERRYPGFLSSQMSFSHISALEKFSIIQFSVTPLIQLSSGWCLLFHVKLLGWLSWQSRAAAPSCYWRANNPFTWIHLFIRLNYSNTFKFKLEETQTYLFFVQSFCLCLLLWWVEVVQRRVIDGQSHWLLALDVDDLNHWSLLLTVFQMEPGEVKVWNSVTKSNSAFNHREPTTLWTPTLTIWIFSMTVLTAASTFSVTSSAVMPEWPIRAMLQDRTSMSNRAECMHKHGNGQFLIL